MAFQNAALKLVDLKQGLAQTYFSFSRVFLFFMLYSFVNHFFLLSRSIFEIEMIILLFSIRWLHRWFYSVVHGYFLISRHHFYKYSRSHFEVMKEARDFSGHTLYIFNHVDKKHSYGHTHKQCDFRIQGTSICVYPLKSQFRKFDPKTILSLPYVGKIQK